MDQLFDELFIISIHAPLTGSDRSRDVGGRLVYHFNPRSPHRERHGFADDIKAAPYISIHAPLTGSDGEYWFYYLVPGISIHAPLTGSDALRTKHLNDSEISIHAPLTGSDVNRSPVNKTDVISIHAPLTGSDNMTFDDTDTTDDFNPRSPHRERLARS